MILVVIFIFDMSAFIYTASLCGFTNIYCRNFGVGFSVSTGLPCSSKPGGVGIVLCAMVFYLNSY
jgi:hypothetical protein